MALSRCSYESVHVRFATTHARPLLHVGCTLVALAAQSGSLSPATFGSGQEESDISDYALYGPESHVKARYPLPWAITPPPPSSPVLTCQFDKPVTYIRISNIVTRLSISLSK
jgi:hypothetical protein